MELEQFQKEIVSLRREKEVYEAQSRLFETFIAMARSPLESGTLKITMQNVLDIATRFSNAEKSSLFLTDKDGRVTDSILVREEISGDKRSELIGQVLDKGLAGWVKDNLSPALISDTKEDDRWIILPGQSYESRSVLAVPVIRDDTLFGIITLMHSLPSQFSRATLEFIQNVADQMSVVLENAKLYIKLEKANQDIEKYSRALRDELERGKKIQKDFLPRGLPEVSNCDIAAYFHAALQLSGDFFDIFELPDNHVGLVVGDVSGKGVGSALFMALTRSLFRIFSGIYDTGDKLYVEGFQKCYSPRKTLQSVQMINDYLSKEHGEDCMFVTVFYGVINLETGRLFYVNGGHEPAVVIGENGLKKNLSATGPLLGPIPGANYEIGEIQLEKNDTILCFTDGVTEARSDSKELYTRARLEKILSEDQGISSIEVLEKIKYDLSAFVGGAPQSDDITMLAARWC